MSVITNNYPDLEVNVVDVNKTRIDDWNNTDLRKLPIFEPGLEKIIEKCRGRNLFFFTNVEEQIALADMILISVN